MRTEEEKLELAELEHSIRLGNAIEKLFTSPEFNLIYKEYTETQVLNLTYSLGSLEMNVLNKDNVTKRLEAIALFKMFIENTASDLANAIERKHGILNGEDK